MKWSKRTKTVAAAAAAAGGVALLVWAVAASFPGQTHAGPSELTLHPERQEAIIAERRAASLAAELRLNAEQRAAVEAIMLEARRSLIDLRAKHAGDVLGMIQARRNHMQSVSEQIQAQLNPEQQERFVDMRSDVLERVGLLRAIMRPRAEAAGLNPPPLEESPFPELEGASQ